MNPWTVKDSDHHHAIGREEAEMWEAATDAQRDKAAEGIAQALTRDLTEQTNKTKRGIEDLEARITALAKEMGIEL